ncbi:hypothetical protein [Reticulibacter mediterranei]|uniref:hypothetical protein n=1 Tax=Reticulibacter mediterranei TaxID=2778369 RepID=UPI001C693BC3|nr:hypothetical protein [Reticulibacter mediterranei]
MTLMLIHRATDMLAVARVQHGLGDERSIIVSPPRHLLQLLIWVAHELIEKIGSLLPRGHADGIAGLLRELLEPSEEFIDGVRLVVVRHAVFLSALLRW